MPALLALKALPWRLIGLGTLAFAILALFAHDRIVSAQNGKLKAQLHALTEQSKQRKKETGETITHYVRVTVPQVQTEVREIESAPLPGNCKTPKAVMDADI